MVTDDGPVVHTSGPNTQVMHIGHIAGAVAGFLLGNVLLKLNNLKSYKTWKKAIWWYSLVVFLMFFFGAIFTKIFCDHNIEDDIASQSFPVFDVDGDGLITKDELITNLSNNGEHLNDSEVKDIIAAVDLDDDGKINSREFQIIVLNYLYGENDS